MKNTSNFEDTQQNIKDDFKYFGIGIYDSNKLKTSDLLNEVKNFQIKILEIFFGLQTNKNLDQWKGFANGF